MENATRAENHAHPRIAAAAPELRRRALLLVLADVPSDDRAQNALEIEASDAAFEGLLAAERESRLVGAIWAQPQVGRNVIVWPPQLADGEPEATADELLARALDFATRQGAKLAQSLVTHQAERSTARLRRGGFEHMADLVYLLALDASFPESPAETELSFEAYDAGNHDRFVGIVEETYVGTLDCPALDGVRDCQEVLAGYRATGEFDPSNWLLAKFDGRDAGCLLLADHPRMNHAELVYMGLAKWARGRKWGRDLARRAQWLARCLSRRGLLAAVDAANHPAVDAYAETGFHVWDRRAAYLKRL